MAMIIYQPLRTNMIEFVEFWSLRYKYADEHLYTENIGNELIEQRILDLFRWKNGTPLSNRKRTSVLHNFIDRKRELEHLRPYENAKDVLERFANGGAIWRIFWAHCWQPARFPIYDQHVHRAMAFIQAGAREEIAAYDPKKIESYIQRYLPFHATFDCIDNRSVDKALWAFGKFINEVNFPMIAANDTR